MKFIIWAIALLLAPAVLSKPLSAETWPTKEIWDSCPKLAQHTIKEVNAVVNYYYGCGIANVDEPSPWKQLNEGADPTLRMLRDSQVTQQELLEITFRSLAKRLNDTKESFTYAETDPYFVRLLDVMARIDWSLDDTTDTNALIGPLVDTINLARYYGKRYGLQVIKTMLKIYELHPDSKRVEERMPWAFSAFIDADKVTYPSENPTTGERVEIAMELLEFHRTNPKLPMWGLSMDAQYFLEETTPGLLKEWRDLRAERGWASGY